MLSIVLHGIMWHCMELLCILCYRIVFMLYRYCMVLYYILRYCIVGFGARAVSRKTPIYFICNNPCSKKVSRPWCSIVGDKKDDKSES